jgi:hypothetical protein
LTQVIVLLSQSILRKAKKRSVIEANSDSSHPDTTLPIDLASRLRTRKSEAVVAATLREKE